MSVRKEAFLLHCCWCGMLFRDGFERPAALFEKARLAALWKSALADDDDDAAVVKWSVLEGAVEARLRQRRGANEPVTILKEAAMLVNAEV